MVRSDIEHDLRELEKRQTESMLIKQARRKSVMAWATFMGWLGSMASLFILPQGSIASVIIGWMVMVPLFVTCFTYMILACMSWSVLDDYRRLR